MKRFFVTCLLAFAAGYAVAQPADDSLYRAFGERAGLTALMQDFVQRLVADPRTQPFFKNASLERLQVQLTDQLCMLSGGPCTYTGRDMKSVHAGLAIGKADFNALAEVLQDAMDARGIPFRDQNRILARLAPMHREIVNR